MCEKIVERGFLEKRIKKDNKTSGRNGQKRTVTKENQRKQKLTHNISYYMAS